MATNYLDLYNADRQARFGAPVEQSNLQSYYDSLNTSTNAIASKADEKRWKLDERSRIKANRLGGSNRDANDLTVQNQGIINNLKGAANYLLPESMEFNKYEYDAKTDTDYLLDEDTNERLTSGKFDYKGDFTGYAAADMDSPFDKTRVNGIDSTETHYSSDPASKYQKTKNEAGATDAEMLSLASMQTQMVDDFAAANPGYEFTGSGSDFSGNRTVLEGKEFNDYMLANGGAVPGRDAGPEAHTLYNKAKAEGKGLWSTEVGSRVGDAAYIYNQFDSEGGHPKGVVNRALNTGKAFVNSLGAQVVDLADVGVEALGGDLGTDDEKTKMVKDFVGYDSHYDERAQEVASQAVNRMFKFGVNTNNVGDVLEAAYTNPEMIGTSFGYVLPMLMSAPLSIAGKATTALKVSKAALDAGKITKAAYSTRVSNITSSLGKGGVTLEGATTVENIAKVKSQYKSMSKAMDILKSNAGIFAFSAGKANDDIEARVLNNGGTDLTPLDKAGIYFTSVIYNKVDSWASMGILKSPEVLQGVKAMVKATGSGELKTLAKDLAALSKETLKTTGYVLADSAKEGGTEGLQEIMDIIVTEYQTKSNSKGLGELLSDNAERITVSTGMGIAGASQFTATSAARESVKPAINAVKDGVTKGKEALNKDKTGIAKTTATNNPSLDSKDIQARTKVHNEEATHSYTSTKGDMGDTVVTPTEGKREVNTAVNNELDVADGAVNDVVEDTATEYSEDETSAMYAGGQKFEDAFNRASAAMSKPLEDITAKGKNSDTTKEDKKFTPVLAQYARDTIAGLQAARDSVAKAAKGRSPKKLALMDAKIARLAPMLVAANTAEMKDIMDNAAIEDKVYNVLGSSAASLEDVNAAIAEAEASDKVSNADKELLEFKKTVLTSIKRVKGDKLIGGGNRPGVIQWAQILAANPNNEQAKKAITDFVAGQRAKAAKFVKAAHAWDVENKMPWTLEGDALAAEIERLSKDGKYDKYFKDGKFPTEFKEDPKGLKNTRHEFRAAAIAAQDAKDNLSKDVELGNKRYKTVMATAAIAHEVAAEQLELEKLLKIAGISKTSPESNSEATEAEQKSDDKVVEEDVTSPSEPVMEPTITEAEGDLEYSTAVKKGVRTYIMSDPAIIQYLSDNNIDVEGC